MEREQEEAETRVDSIHLGGPECLHLTRVQERERERERERESKWQGGAWSLHASPRGLSLSL